MAQHITDSLPPGEQEIISGFANKIGFWGGPGPICQYRVVRHEVALDEWEVTGCLPWQVSMASPQSLPATDVRRWWEASDNAQGGTSRPSPPGEGKAEKANVSEPAMTPRKLTSSDDG